MCESYVHYLYNRERLEIYKQFYYRHGESGISDFEYDILEQGLIKLEEEYPEWPVKAGLNPTSTLVGTNKDYDYIVTLNKSPDKIIKELWATKYKQLYKEQENELNKI